MAEHDVRPYKVLEQQRNGTYRVIWEGDARNSEHAARQAFKDASKKSEDELITVPLKMWTPVPVKRNVKETVSVG